MYEILQDYIANSLIALIVTGITGGISWYFVKRHFQKKELKEVDASIDSTTSDNVSKNLILYQTMLDDVVQRKDAEIASLREDLLKRDVIIERLEEGLKKLKKRVEELEG
jgi:hypothetical protein